MVRHAGAERAWVRLGYEHDALVVEVRDDGVAGARTGTAGFGLRGMGERVESLGGELSYGPHPDGGFALRAVLPRDRSAP